MTGRLKVHIYPADKGGCGRYRLLHAALHLKEQGYDITVHDPDRPMDIKVYVTDRGEVTNVAAPEADVLVMQRVTNHIHAQAMALLREQGYAVVLDADDDLTCIHPGNKAFYKLHEKGASGQTVSGNNLASRNATLMTVSTPNLLGVYAPHGRGVVIDNYVPRSYLDLYHVDTPTFGWPGSIETHPNDLPVVGPAVQRLVDEGFEFMQVGPHEREVARLLGLEKMKATGGVPLKYWASTVSRVGVALAPLADTTFNKSKSRLKILEANSVGVPYVASPRAEYAAMTRAGGAGLLADKPKDWFRQIRRLLTDHKLRKDMSAQGREFAATQVVEDHAWRWMEAWQYARDLQNGVAAPVGSRALVDLAG